MPAHVRGEDCPVAYLLYGSGLRLMEALRLRIKDVNCSCQQVKTTRVYTHLIRKGANAVCSPLHG